MGRVALLMVLAVSGIARAQVDPDTQAARRHYTRGLELYDQEHYAEAVKEFEAAKELKPSPAFEYNIGRCQERLERWSDAADSYERYLMGAPDASERGPLTQRIAVLRQRGNRHGGEPATPPPEPLAPKPLPTTNAPTTNAPTTSVAAPAIASQPPRPIYKRAWFWGVVAGGAVAVALGVGLGLGLSGGDGTHPIMDVRF